VEKNDCRNDWLKEICLTLYRATEEKVNTKKRKPPAKTGGKLLVLCQD